MTKQEAIAELASWDHAFVKPEGLKMVCDAFNLPLPWGKRKKPPTARVDPPGTFKGFTAWDDNGNLLPPGTRVEGMDASDFAEWLCKEVTGANAGAIYLGRGFRLHACVKALREHVEQEAARNR